MLCKGCCLLSTEPWTPTQVRLHPCVWKGQRLLLLPVCLGALWAELGEPQGNHWIPVAVSLGTGDLNAA